MHCCPKQQKSNLSHPPWFSWCFEHLRHVLNSCTVQSHSPIRLPLQSYGFSQSAHSAVCLCCRGLVKVTFNLYRLVVLPVANTWMSWSLLQKLQWTASAPVLVSLALLSIFLLTLGLKVGTLCCAIVKVGNPANVATEPALLHGWSLHECPELLDNMCASISWAEHQCHTTEVMHDAVPVSLQTALPQHPDAVHLAWHAYKAALHAECLRVQSVETTCICLHAGPLLPACSAPACHRPDGSSKCA